MTEYTHTDLQLVGVHVPDQMVDAQGNAASPLSLGYDTPNPISGTYQIGVVIEGAFVPLITEKASLVFDKIELAKQAQADASSSSPDASQTPAESPAAPPVEQPAASPADQPQG